MIPQSLLFTSWKCLFAICFYIKWSLIILHNSNVHKKYATLYNSSLRENTLIDDLVVNGNGLCFHEFFNRNCLSVLNTWFTHKKCRWITWHSPDGVTKKVYNLALSCNWLRQYVRNCRVYNSFDFDSDHRLVIADIGTPSSKIGWYVLRKKTQKNNALNLKCLWEPLFHNTFIENAVTKLEQIDLLQTSNSEINEMFVTCINSSAEEAIPTVEKSRLYDEELKHLYQLKDN